MAGAGLLPASSNPPNHGLERGVSLGTIGLHEFHESAADSLQISPRVRVLRRRPIGREQLAHPLPDEQQFAVGLEEEILVQYPRGHQRGHHFPVAHHHAKVGVLLGAGRGDSLHILHGGRMEVRREPFAGLSQFLFPPQFIEPQNQVGIVVGGLSRHETIIPRATILSDLPFEEFMETLAEQLARQTREAALYRPLDRNRVECFACGHRCPISAGFAGVCKVRFNRGGKLYAPYGYVNAVHCDPIEKKPFYHALPGTGALSFGMLGCDLHCGYCQNWVSSQALRDIRSSLDFQAATPRELVNLALRSGAASLVSTYNEPLITAEWAVAVFREAKAAGLATGFVSKIGRAH